MATTLHDALTTGLSTGLPLPNSTTIRSVHLRVSDLARSLRFYRDMLGLEETSSHGATIVLSASGSTTPLLRLTEDGAAPRRSVRAPGLFHLALLYPTRLDLAAAFRNLSGHRWPFQGFADHGVSEALYLADPDGNGIELYRDRPREQWPYRDGELEMVTEPLDAGNLLSELPGTRNTERLRSHGVTIGHIHLQVSDIGRTEQFYHETLGFDVVQRNFPGALFMSAGGYHHHIGANIWNSRGSAPMTEGSLGLVEFGISLGKKESLNDLAARLRSSEHWIAETSSGYLVRDADHIRISIT
jgi:catechol 2,3-dioxygenase